MPKRPKVNKVIMRAVELLLLGIMLSACKRQAQQGSGNMTENRLRQLIVGEWAADDVLAADNKRVASSKTTNFFAPNGSYTFISAKIEGNTMSTFLNQGTWSLTNQDLILTTTNSSQPKLQPVGTVGLAHIIRANDNQLIYKLNGGLTISFDRVK
jgi:hypothetical protein